MKVQRLSKDTYFSESSRVGRNSEAGGTLTEFAEGDDIV